MPDGSRKRRHCPNRVKRTWYARYRSIRFARRFFPCAEASTSRGDQG